MKKNAIFLALTACFGMTSCDRQTKLSQSQMIQRPAAEEIVHVQVQVPVEPERHLIDLVPQKAADAGTLDDLARNVGFAAKLPKGVDIYFGIKDLEGLFRKVMGGKMGTFAKKMMEMSGQSFEEMLKEESLDMALEIGGQEVFFATASGGDGQMENFVDFFSVFQDIAHNAQAQQILGQPQGGMGLLGGIFTPKNVKKMLESFQNIQAFPIYAGVKITDPKKREIYREKVQDGIESMMENMGEGADFIQGVLVQDKYAGIEFIGERFVDYVQRQEDAEMTKQSIDDTLGAGTYDMVMNALREKNFLLLVGVEGEHIVVFSGAKREQLKFARTPEESFLASPELAFAKHYAKKDIQLFSYTSEEVVVLGNKYNQLLGGYAKAFLNILEKHDNEKQIFKDAIQSMQKLIDVEKVYLANLHVGSGGMVGYLEDGYKLQFHGQAAKDNMLLDVPHEFAELSAHGDVLISSNYHVNHREMQKLYQYLETAYDAAFDLGKCVLLQQGLVTDPSEVAEDAEKLSEAEYATQLFNTMLSGEQIGVQNYAPLGDVLTNEGGKFWIMLTQQMPEAFDSEEAWIIDLKGSMPKHPKIPERFQQDIMVPRFLSVTKMKDKQKVQAIGEAFLPIVQSASKKIASAWNRELTIGAPESMTRAGGLKSWNYQMPWFNDNLKPCWAMDEANFYTSSSPQMIDSYRKLLKDNTVGLPGAYFKINFDPARRYATELFEKVTKDPKAYMFQGGKDIQQLRVAEPFFREFLEASKELKQISFCIRNMGEGEQRTTIHIETR